MNTWKVTDDKMQAMRSLLILIAGMILGSTNATYGQLTLESCQQKAKDNYPMIKQYELIEQTRDFTLSNANKSYLPQLDVNLIAGVIHGLPSIGPPGSETNSTDFNGIAILQLKQLIWDGGITKSKKAIAQANAEVEKADVDISIFKLEERVNNLYFGILLINEQIEQLRLLKSTLERNMQRVEVAIENGTAHKTDMYELKAEIIGTEQKVEELATNKKAYLTVLSAMIGEQVNERETLVKPALTSNIFELPNNRPELRLFQYQSSLIEARSEIDRSMLYPKIGLIGFGTFIQPGIDFGASTINEIMVGGLSLNWSISALYQNKNHKKLTEVGLQKVQNQKETFLFNNGLELSRTGTELRKFETLLRQDREILDLKSNIRKAYEVMYDNGTATMTDLLNKTSKESIAKQKLAAHEIQYLMNLYQYKNQSGN